MSKIADLFEQNTLPEPGDGRLHLSNFFYAKQIILIDKLTQSLQQTLSDNLFDYYCKQFKI